MSWRAALRAAALSCALGAMLAGASAIAAPQSAATDWLDFDLAAMWGPNWGPMIHTGGPSMPDGREITNRALLTGELDPPPPVAGLTGAAAAKAEIARARDYLAQSKIEKAKAALMSATASEPNNVEALFLLARIIAVHEPTLALSYAHRAIAAAGENASADLYATRAAIAAQRGDNDGAQADAQRALALDPQHGLRAAILSQAERAAPSRQTPVMVDGAQRREATARFEMEARVVHPRLDPKGAVDAAIMSGVDNPMLRVKRAERRAAENDWEGAIADIDTLLKGSANTHSTTFAPGFAASLLCLRADSALQLGRADHARADMRSAAFEGDTQARLRAQLALRAFGSKTVAIDGADTPRFRESYEACLASAPCLKAAVAFLRPKTGG